MSVSLYYHFKYNYTLQNKKFRVGKFEYFIRVRLVNGNRDTFFSLKGSIDAVHISILMFLSSLKPETNFSKLPKNWCETDKSKIKNKNLTQI